MTTMTPKQAITKAINNHVAAVNAAAPWATKLDRDYLDGLTQASKCLDDMVAMLRYIRAQLPDREPELYKLISSQLLKGCNL